MGLDAILERGILRRETVRFLLAGGINTLILYGLYLLFRILMHYNPAYTAAYLLSIFSAYGLNCLLVFRVRVRLATFLAFPLVYLVQYGLNLAFLNLFVKLGMGTGIAPLAAVSAGLPAVYLMMRRVLRARGEGPA